MLALNFYSPVFADQLRHRRKTATIRLGDKSAKYTKGEVVMVLIGHRFGPRELLFHADYGCQVHEQKGRKNAAVAGLLSALYVREAVASDPRISSVLAARAGVDGDAIRVEVEAQTISGHPVDLKTQV